MTRITFFIGNGFDLNVGLDTRYEDFYNYYTENQGDKLAQAIGSDYKYWADLEEGLGKYTANVTQEEEDSFWESENKLEEGLADYLEMQMERIHVKDDVHRDSIAKEMQKSLNQFYMEFPKEQRQDISHIIGNIRESITYSFVSFNYTNALDLCLEITKSTFPKGSGSHQVGSVTYNHSIGSVLHIHGTTKEEMIVGLNDEGQIANERFRQSPRYRQWLIKSATNGRFGQNKTKELQDIVNNSSIICIFGMSLGKTDKMWWESICKWLSAGPNRRLVIYVKKNMKDVKRVTKRLLFMSQDEVLDKMKSYSGLDDVAWDKLTKQIYVKFDAKIFDFKLVEEHGDELKRF